MQEINLKGYDGTLSFPDEMGSEEISKVLRKNFPDVANIANVDGSWKVDPSTLPLRPMHPNESYVPKDLSLIEEAKKMSEYASNNFWQGILGGMISHQQAPIATATERFIDELPFSNVVKAGIGIATTVGKVAKEFLSPTGVSSSSISNIVKDVAGEPLGDIKEFTKELDNTLRNTPYGKKLEVESERLKAISRDLADEQKLSWKDYEGKPGATIARGVGENVIANMPWYLTAFATKKITGSTSAGLAGGLVPFYITAFGSKYAEVMDNPNLDESMKNKLAHISGMSEVGTELLPFKIAMKPGINLAARYLLHAGLEVPGELINDVVNFGIDKYASGAPITQDDIKKQFISSTMQTIPVTLISSLFFAGASHPLATRGVNKFSDILIDSIGTNHFEGDIKTAYDKLVTKYDNGRRSPEEARRKAFTDIIFTEDGAEAVNKAVGKIKGNIDLVNELKVKFKEETGQSYEEFKAEAKNEEEIDVVRRALKEKGVPIAKKITVDMNKKLVNLGYTTDQIEELKSSPELAQKAIADNLPVNDKVRPVSVALRATLHMAGVTDEEIDKMDRQVAINFLKKGNALSMLPVAIPEALQVAANSTQTDVKLNEEKIVAKGPEAVEKITKVVKEKKAKKEKVAKVDRSKETKVEGQTETIEEVDRLLAEAKAELKSGQSIVQETPAEDLPIVTKVDEETKIEEEVPATGHNTTVHGVNIRYRLNGPTAIIDRFALEPGTPEREGKGTSAFVSFVEDMKANHPEVKTIQADALPTEAAKSFFESLGFKVDTKADISHLEHTGLQRMKVNMNTFEEEIEAPASEVQPSPALPPSVTGHVTETEAGVVPEYVGAKYLKVYNELKARGFTREQFDQMKADRQLTVVYEAKLTPADIAEMQDQGNEVKPDVTVDDILGIDKEIEGENIILKDRGFEQEQIDVLRDEDLIKDAIDSGKTMEEYYATFDTGDVDVVDDAVESYNETGTAYDDIERDEELDFTKRRTAQIIEAIPDDDFAAFAKAIASKANGGLVTGKDKVDLITKDGLNRIINTPDEELSDAEKYMKWEMLNPDGFTDDIKAVRSMVWKGFFYAPLIKQIDTAWPAGNVSKDEALKIIRGWESKQTVNLDDVPGIIDYINSKDSISKSELIDWVNDNQVTIAVKEYSNSSADQGAIYDLQVELRELKDKSSDLSWKLNELEAKGSQRTYDVVNKITGEVIYNYEDKDAAERVAKAINETSTDPEFRVKLEISTSRRIDVRDTKAHQELNREWLNNHDRISEINYKLKELRGHRPSYDRSDIRLPGGVNYRERISAVGIKVGYNVVDIADNTILATFSSKEVAKQEAKRLSRTQGIAATVESAAMDKDSRDKQIRKLNGKIGYLKSQYEATTFTTAKEDMEAYNKLSNDIIKINEQIAKINENTNIVMRDKHFPEISNAIGWERVDERMLANVAVSRLLERLEVEYTEALEADMAIPGEDRVIPSELKSFSHWAQVVKGINLDDLDNKIKQIGMIKFIDELQESDWVTANRDIKPMTQEEAAKTLGLGEIVKLSASQQGMIDDLIKMNLKVRKAGIASSPMLTQAKEFMIKDSIRDAVARGMRGLGWNTGINIKDRYERALRKLVDKVKVTDLGNGMYQVLPFKEGHAVEHRQLPTRMTIEQIKETYGESTATDVINKNYRVGLERNEIPVTFDAKWPIELYDNRIPKIIQELSDKNGWGVKIVDVRDANGNDIHYVEFTPALISHMQMGNLPIRGMKGAPVRTYDPSILSPMGGRSGFRNTRTVRTMNYYGVMNQINKEATVKIAEAKNAFDLMTILAEAETGNGLRSITREFALMLLHDVKGVSAQLKKIDFKLIPDIGLVHYSPDLHRIELTDSYVGMYSGFVFDSMLHETIHALTLNKLDMSPKMDKYFKDHILFKTLDALSSDERRLVTLMRNANESGGSTSAAYAQIDFPDKKSFYKYYALINKYEFLASYAADLDFQAFLKSIPVDNIDPENSEKKPNSMWGRLLSFINNAIKQTDVIEVSKQEEISMLDRIVSFTAELVASEAEESFKSWTVANLGVSEAEFEDVYSKHETSGIEERKTLKRWRHEYNKIMTRKFYDRLVTEREIKTKVVSMPQVKAPMKDTALRQRLVRVGVGLQNANHYTDQKVWNKEMISLFGEEVKPFLNATWNNVEKMSHIIQTALKSTEKYGRIDMSMKAVSRISSSNPFAKLNYDNELIPMSEADFNMLNMIDRKDYNPGFMKVAVNAFTSIDNALGTNFKERYFDTYNAAATNARREKLERVQAIQAIVKKYNLSETKSSIRIYDYAMSLQPEAVATMKKMDVKAPTWEQLSVGEQELYSVMRGYFEADFIRLNAARKIAGKRPLSYVTNYFTFARAVKDMQDEGIDIARMSDSFIKHRMGTMFKFDIRKKSTIPFERNAIGIFGNYSEYALNYIHKTPVIASMNNLINFAWNQEDNVTLDGKVIKHNIPRGLVYDAPRAYEWMQNWINYESGLRRDREKVVLSKGVTRVTNRLLHNSSAATMSYNFGVAIKQFSSIDAVFAEVGLVSFTTGLSQWATSEQMRQFIKEKSNVTLIRNNDITMMESLNDLMLMKGKDITSVKGLFKAYYAAIIAKGYKPIQVFDMAMANIAWLSAYDYADRQGLKGQAAYTYADDLVLRTQGSGATAHTSQGQKVMLGKIMGQFQTFAIARFDWYVEVFKSVLGDGNWDRKKALAILFRYLIATAVFDYLYNIAGIGSPNPQVIKTMVNSRNERDDLPEVLRKGIVEGSGYLPYIGGMKYRGTAIGGPLVSDASRIFNTISKKKWEYDNWTTWVAPFAETTLKYGAGAPGIAQMKRMYRGVSLGYPYGSMMFGPSEEVYSDFRK